MLTVPNTTEAVTTDTAESSGQVLEDARAHARTHATYAVISGDVLMDPNLSSHAKVIYGLLDLHQGTNGSAWPSVDRLAALSGLSRSTVQRATAELVEAGWITVTQRAYSTNRYRVRNPARARWEARTGSPRASQVTPPRVMGDTPYRVMGDAVTMTKEQLTNNNNGPTLTSTPTPPTAAVVAAVDPQVRELLEALPADTKPTRALRADLAALAASEWTAADVREWVKAANGPTIVNPGGLAARLIREATDTAVAPPTKADREARAQAEARRLEHQRTAAIEAAEREAYENSPEGQAEAARQRAEKEQALAELKAQLGHVAA